ncbi:esterase-like activity of phytase family protein [Paucibacter sp. PLA-PC-4]|uniref:esterase-like activity of phytase family protein n=1 Tax=Paucibacter sp. PLA-PC-4 TaxID=2993655 RepID=UPI002248FCD2|nr:esterase-like activity of phytase family protein [Paucibacter sp. PLA-PC-4]MCX2862521.1 esterase-like activity of phytase family protein [Paucibacter sp. PLA-PC-4]
MRTIPLLLALLSAFSAQAQQAYPATLAGHSVLPALSFVSAPKNAPASLRTSGKYTAADGRREDRLEVIAGSSYLSAKGVPKPTGISLPFRGQPVQGFSGIKAMADGSYWVLSDNGYGSKANSADAMLMFHQLKLDWKSGAVQRQQTVFLHDPDKKLPFLIVNEATPQRYLTGTDLDIESMQFIGEHVWFGDELGPYLLKTDRKGRVLAVYETLVDGKPVRSPDHFAVTTPATPGAFTTPVRRSRGYEGMAASKDGQFLYPLLEGPLWNESSKQWEHKDGREYLRVLEFNVAKGEWTGRSWKYALEANGNNIGDFNMIDADTGLIIERDNGEGLADTACEAAPRPDCQNVPARFKRVYKISLKDADADGFVRKIGYVDLLDIQDPKGLARVGGKDGRFSFPFVTIEDVDVVDAEHIVVANDNNLPYSSGRRLGRNDDNEFILLHVPGLLSAR